MELLPIQERLEDNAEFLTRPECAASLEMTVKYIASLGYHPPWIGYYASQHGELVGTAAFKGRPGSGRVEIAYGTFDDHQGKGVGGAICTALVKLSLDTDPSVVITARTLPEENHSTRILRKNGFVLEGVVMDDDDGEVWEWVRKGSIVNGR